MLTVPILFFTAALVTAILSAMGKCPPWVGVILLAMAGLWQSLR